MSEHDVLDRARHAFESQAWKQAYLSFRAADEDGALVPEDLDLLARAAYLVGQEEECVRVLERAYHQRIAEDQAELAAETAFWLAFNLLNRGETARAGGWMTRVGQLVEAQGPDCAVRGLLLIPAGLQRLMGGDPDAAIDVFTQARQLGVRCRDPELVALGGLGTGQAMIAAGEVGAGLAQLDEVMVAVTAGEVSPIVSGIVYCAVIIACHETYELQRAAEWTKALSRWCDAQPDLVPFRGQCLVHRAQILQLNGAWTDAMEEAHRARRRLSDPPGQPAIGMALYEQAELHRLRGEFTEAEDAYRQSSRRGHETQPGFALLRLAQGEIDAARAGIRRALEESHTVDRPRLLVACVDIALAADDAAEARRAADQLAAIAAGRDATVLQAMSAQATGSVLLAGGEARRALERLRRAWTLWRALDAPYPAAQVRLLQGRACELLGDHDTARMEFEAAAEVFHQLRAKPDLAELEQLGVQPEAASTGALTAREVQVLRAVATGKTNRAVAEELFLSEKTVARHLSNIFAKLDLSSRAAATAYAYEHDLI